MTTALPCPQQQRQMRSFLNCFFNFVDLAQQQGCKVTEKGISDFLYEYSVLFHSRHKEPSGPGLFKVTPEMLAEMELLQSHGLPYSEIGFLVGVTPGTVKKYLKESDI